MVNTVIGREKEIFSEHIFFIPFKMSKSKEISPEVWKKEFLLREIKDGVSVRQYYSIMRYFDRQAKSIILNREEEREEYISNFLFRPLLGEEKAYYHICIDEYQRYQLDLETIRLRRFRNESAEKDLYLLMIYTKNSRYSRLKDIKKINQYGSRIYNAVLPYSEIEELEEGDVRRYIYSDCAQGLGVQIGEEFFLPRKQDEKEFEMDFFNQDLNYTKGMNELSDWKRYIEEPKRTPVVEELVNYGSQKELIPEYITGDRMFVCYLIKNDSLMKQVKRFDKEKFQYSYEFDENISKLLYSIIYIDTDLPSCQSQVMRTNLLKKVILDRWIEGGAVHAVTRNSFGCICSSTCLEEEVPEVFAKEYVEMASIVFMQRVELSEFYKRIKEESDFRVEQLLQLQKEYILFKSKFLLFEVTTQDHGYELYKKMQEESEIELKQQRLENELHTVSERVNIWQIKEMNEKIKFLGIIGMVLAVVGIILVGMEFSFQLYTMFF